MNNPNILIIATVSGTTGEAGFGSHAAGPAFQTVAEAALRLRGVPRDVPEEVEALEEKELAAKEKLKGKQKIAEPQETDPVADLSTPLTDEEVAESVDPNAPKTPDFTGKTVRTVMEEAAADGVDVDMLGNGLAKAQYPVPGSPLPPGEHVRVRFAR